MLTSPSLKTRVNHQHCKPSHHYCLHHNPTHCFPFIYFRLKCIDGSGRRKNKGETKQGDEEKKRKGNEKRGGRAKPQYLGRHYPASNHRPTPAAYQSPRWYGRQGPKLSSGLLNAEYVKRENASRA
ncbi:uncharacterized protein LOC123516566 isoform X2 [Portunus trituberculatus]|uniref:uncharacterized protein LOC123516566 isoform X2 n=1 Tax=Portunus trituberculatus TaxID=210409 RepID=UPI001E1CFE82|nr:uncharacterized protein LOC123516566 isoform X2 [Portunus trituberculatus]